MWATRTSFDRALRELQDQVLVLGSLVDKAIERSMEALRRLDQQAARETIRDDDRIDRTRFQIENQAIELIATQQPAARDLRTIVAVLHIVVELERMGDYAEGIAKICLMHGAQPLLKPLIDLPQMAEMARSMLRRSLQAFIQQDVDLSKSVAAEDDAVDGIYDHVYHELISYMI